MLENLVIFAIIFLLLMVLVLACIIHQYVTEMNKEENSEEEFNISQNSKLKYIYSFLIFPLGVFNTIVIFVSICINSLQLEEMSGTFSD